MDEMLAMRRRLRALEKEYTEKRERFLRDVQSYANDAYWEENAINRLVRLNEMRTRIGAMREVLAAYDAMRSNEAGEGGN